MFGADIFCRGHFLWIVRPRARGATQIDIVRVSTEIFLYFAITR